MKKVLFILFIFSMIGFSFAQTKSPIAIKEASFQNWIAGIQGGGSGTNFVVDFKNGLSKKVVLRKLYFKNQVALPVKVSNCEYQFSFVGDTNFEQGNETNGKQSSKKVVSAPLKINDNQALLEYTYLGKKRFFKITKITEKEILAYPSARPQNQENN